MKTRLFFIVAALGFSSCGKQPAEEVKLAPEPSKAAVVSDAEMEVEITKALSGGAPAATASAENVSPFLAEAESIIAKYPDKTAADLLNVPEVNTKLRNLLGKLGQDKALQDYINSSVKLAAQIKGLDGAVKLDLQIQGYDKPRTSRMLQMVLTEDPQKLVDFLVGEIGEATPDISYGGMERAPNGVAIVPNPDAPASAPPKNDSPE
ncbi:MAG: hypothetical protein R3F13_13760 [Prosthecobacter sp.]